MKISSNVEKTSFHFDKFLSVNPNTHTSLIYISLVRSAYALLVLCYCIVWICLDKTNVQESGLFFACVIEIFIFTTLCCLALLKKRFTSLITVCGMIHDSLLAAFIIFVTGVKGSPFLYLFLIVPLYGGIIMQRRGGILAASCVAAVIAAFLNPPALQKLNAMADSAHYKLDFMPLSAAAMVLLACAAYCVGVLTGHLSYLYANARDSLKKADTDFIHLKGIYGFMLNALPIGIVVKNPQNGNALYANRAAYALLGNGLNIPASTNCKTPQTSQPATTTPQGQKTWIGQLNDKYLSIAQFTLSVQNCAYTGYHISDCTSQIHAQKEQALRERLEHLGEFSAKVAHEIRNPLACISGCNEMLEQDAMTDEQKQIHAMMNGEIERLNRLLNDILVFSRRPKLTPKSINLLQTVQSQADRFLENPKNQNVGFNIDIPQNQIWFTDETALRQILMTLWQNSAEAAGPNARISIRWRPQNALAISDSGNGISPKDLAHIFEPFYTTKTNGTGLGLATARQLAAENQLSLDWNPDMKAFVIAKSATPSAQNPAQ